MKRIKLNVFMISILAVLMLLFSGCKNFMVKNTEPAKIGISWERDFPDGISEDVQMYVDSVKRAGAEPVLLPQIKNAEEAKEVLKTVDAVILTGGEDIDPSYYNEKPHQKAEKPKADRDVSDYWLLKTAIEEDYPVLGTCRGMQFMNAVLGGTLYQDLPSEYKSDIVHRDPKRENFVYHSATVTDKNSFLYKMVKADVITVNSWHHQAVDKLGKGLKVTAVSPDGIVEGVELEGATFVVGTQFHPEWHVGSDDNLQFLPVFEMLRDYGLKHRKQVK